MILKLLEYDAGQNYNDAGYRLRYLNGGRLFGSAVGINLFFVERAKSIDSDEVFEVILTLDEAEMLAGKLLIAVKNGRER